MRRLVAVLFLLLPLPALAGARAEQDPGARQALQEFRRQWTDLHRNTRNMDRDTLDQRRADLIMLLIGHRTDGIRDQLLEILRDPRQEYGPRVTEITMRTLSAWSDDEVAADGILNRLGRLYTNTMPEEVVRQFDQQVPNMIASFASMAPSVTRPRVDRLHPYLDKTAQAFRQDVAIQHAAIDALAHIRAAESVEPLMALMLDLQREMQEYLRRASMLGQGSCDGG